MLRRKKVLAKMVGNIQYSTILKLQLQFNNSTNHKNQRCKFINLFYFFREKKYNTLVRNIYFYLCFVSLELNDYAGCIRNGNELLKKFAGKLTAKTEFTTKQYIAEAYCMLGMSKEALKLL